MENWNVAACEYLKVCFQSYFSEELETYFDLLKA